MSFIDDAPEPTTENPFARRLKDDPSLGKIGLFDRFSLNAAESGIRGTLMGAGTGAAVQSALDAGWYDADEAKAAQQGLARRRDTLQRYEAMPSWSGPLEGLASLGGQMIGGMTSPEALISRIPGLSRLFAPVANRVVGRVAEAAVTQGVVNAATDPIVQGLSIKSGIQKEFDVQQLLLAFPVGAALGGTLHSVSEAAGGLARWWGGKGSPEGARVAVDDNNPATGPGPLHGEEGTVVRMGDDGQSVVVKLDSGQETAIDPRILKNPDVPEVKQPAPEPEGRPAEATKEQPTQSAEAVQAEKIQQEITAPDRVQAPDEITAGLEKDAAAQDRAATQATTDSSQQGNGVALADTPEAAPAFTEYTGQQIKDRFTGADGAFDMGVAGKGIVAEVKSALAEGKKVTIYPDGKPVEITSVAKGMMADAKGQRWGTAPLAMQVDNGKPALRISQPDLQFRQRVAGSQPPAAPQGSPAGAAPDVVTSLHQQSMALAEALDMPLRQGRVGGGKDALGQFDTRQGVTRTKSIADAETVFHEAGHFAEKKIGPDLSNLIKRNSSELGPMDYDAARQDPAEGFAEFVRLFLSNPKAAEKLAPGFSAAFRPFMEGKAPEVLQALDAAQAAHSAYVKAPSDAKLDALVRRQDHGGIFDTLRKEGIGRTVGMVLGKVYHALIDDKAPVARAVRDLARQARDASGVRLKLEGSENPELLSRMFARAQQSAVRDMLDGVRGYHQIAPQGPALRDAINTATGSNGRLGFWNDAKVKEFSNYLVARRGEVLYGKFNAGDLPNRPLALSEGDVKAAIAKAEAENPTFAAAASQIHEYTRELLRKQFDGGLIDRETFDELMKEAFYVPFYRHMDDKPLANGGPASARKSEGPGKTDLVKRIRGSDRDIIDPLQSIMTQTLLVNRTLAHNDIVKSLVGLARKAQKAGATATGRIVEEIPAHQVVGQRFDLAEAVKNAAKESGTSEQDIKVLLGSLADVFGDDPIMAPIFRREPTGARGEPILFYKEAGQLRAVRLIAEEEGAGLYEALASLTPQARDIAVTLGSLAATAKRVGITSNPIFAFTNFVRDQIAAAIIRPDVVPFDPRGIVAEIRQNPVAQMYAAAGGVSPGAGAAGLHEMVRGDIDALSRKGWMVQKVGGISDLLRHGDILSGLKSIAETVGTAESGTRLNVMKTVFEQKKRQGLNEYDAMMEAAWQATDLMDFGRHGSKTLTVRALIPFLNATIVSLDKAARTFVQPLWRAARGDLVTAGEFAEFRNAGLAWFKMAGVGGALGYLYGLMMADHDAYRDANEQLRATHLVIPGGVIGEPGKVLVVPKPFELAIGFNLGEMIGLAAATGDPRAKDFAMNGVTEVLTPPSILTEIPIVSTYAELKLNRSFFTGRDIVPSNLQGLEAAQQFNDKTSSFSRVLGEKLGVSPMKLDHAIGSQFGLWGRDLLAATTAADSNAPDPALEDTMFVRRFIKNADISSETTKQFWAIAGSQNGEFATARQTYESYTNQFNDEAAAQYLASLPAEKRAFVTLQSAANEDGKPAFTADEKRLNPLTRAATAVQAVNAFIKDMQINTQRTLGGNERIAMDPTTRRQLIDNLRILSAMEQRNALVMLKEPGYGDRKLFSTDDQFDVIHSISPAAAEELSTRYATAKIYKTEMVARAWPQAEKQLLRDGSLADIGDLASDAKDEGWAFDGERVTKAGKRRVEIPGQP